MAFPTSSQWPAISLPQYFSTATLMTLLTMCSSLKLDFSPTFGSGTPVAYTMEIYAPIYDSTRRVNGLWPAFPKGVPWRSSERIGRTSFQSMVLGSTLALKTDDGRFLPLMSHLSPMKDGTKLFGIFLKIFKKSIGLPFLCCWILSKVYWFL